jgi:TolA-binding protein
MRILGVAALCLFGLTAWAMDEAERLQFADGLFSRGMYELASKEYQGFLTDLPASARADVAHFRLGECFQRLGDRAAADKEYRHVFNVYTNSAYRAKAAFSRADMFMELKQYADAEDLFKTTLSLNPAEDVAAASWYFLGEALLNQNRAAEAATALTSAKDKYPANAFCSYALLRLGEIYGRLPAATNAPGPASSVAPDLDKALAFFSAAAAKPASGRVAAEALFQIGDLHFRRNAYDKSAEAYKKLLTSYPADQRSAESRLQAAWAAHNAGLYTDAMSSVDTALKANPPKEQVAEWLYLKANCERQLMHRDDAVKTYAALLDGYPASAFANAARYEKALTFFQKGAFQEAIAEANKVDLGSDLKKDVYWLLAESYAAVKAEDQAIQYYRLLIRDFPRSDVT